MRSVPCFLSACVLFLTVASALYAQELPFQLISGNRAVVRGTVAGGHELAMLVDTGAECTVIDTRAAKRMRLTFLPQTVKYSAFGRVQRAPVAVVSDLRVGPISTSLECVVGDIPTRGVDMILGLNLLSKRNFEIDYARRKIVFEPGDAPLARVPFESEATLIVIKARVHGETIRMLVDTGAAVHCVFENGPVVWLRHQEDPTEITPHMGGSSQAREVSMEALAVGPLEWKNLKAMAIDNPKPDLWDAVLSVGSLGLREVYFDFERRSLGWVR